uniref:Rhodanese domain-containing protein n=1 Tax=Macrostomum lignano TaxID=282301 RepID=A0A1I8FC80_9PLAT
GRLTLCLTGPHVQLLISGAEPRQLGRLGSPSPATCPAGRPTPPPATSRALTWCSSASVRSACVASTPASAGWASSASYVSMATSSSLCRTPINRLPLTELKPAGNRLDSKSVPPALASSLAVLDLRDKAAWPGSRL